MPGNLPDVISSAHLIKTEHFKIATVFSELTCYKYDIAGFKKDI
jgi:hypothetical protein